MITNFNDFRDFLNEKKSPYTKETIQKYKKRYDAGEELPVGIQNSLKAQGIIPRANGKIEVSDEYKTTSLLGTSDNKEKKVKPIEKPVEKNAFDKFKKVKKVEKKAKLDDVKKVEPKKKTKNAFDTFKKRKPKGKSRNIFESFEEDYLN